MTAIESLGIGKSFGFVYYRRRSDARFFEHKTLPGIEALKSK